MFKMVNFVSCIFYHILKMVFKNDTCKMSTIGGRAVSWEGYDDNRKPSFMDHMWYSWHKVLTNSFSLLGSLLARFIIDKTKEGKRLPKAVTVKRLCQRWNLRWALEERQDFGGKTLRGILNSGNRPRKGTETGWAWHFSCLLVPLMKFHMYKAWLEGQTMKGLQFQIKGTIF